jgi:hypothetical protein
VLQGFRGCSCAQPLLASAPRPAPSRVHLFLSPSGFLKSAVLRAMQASPAVGVLVGLVSSHLGCSAGGGAGVTLHLAEWWGVCASGCCGCHVSGSQHLYLILYCPFRICLCFLSQRQPALPLPLPSPPTLQTWLQMRASLRSSQEQGNIAGGGVGWICVRWSQTMLVTTRPPLAFGAGLASSLSCWLIGSERGFRWT